MLTVLTDTREADQVEVSLVQSCFVCGVDDGCSCVILRDKEDLSMTVKECRAAVRKARELLASARRVADREVVAECELLIKEREELLAAAIVKEFKDASSKDVSKGKSQGVSEGHARKG